MAHFLQFSQISRLLYKQCTSSLLMLSSDRYPSETGSGRGSPRKCWRGIRHRSLCSDAFRWSMTQSESGELGSHILRTACTVFELRDTAGHPKSNTSSFLHVIKTLRRWTVCVRGHSSCPDWLFDKRADGDAIAVGVQDFV